jgi:hypothetical protein
MMKFGIVIALLASASALAQSPAPTAAAQPNVLDRAINQPGIGWTLYGPNQSGKQVAATGVPGAGAVRVEVKRKGANPWDSGALYPTSKPIAAGDTILIAVYLRAPNAAPGETVAIPLGATGSEAPYPTIAQATVQVGPEWKLHYASAKATQAFGPAKAQASVQLAGAKQVLELGPAFILNFGQNYDPAKLPK